MSLMANPSPFALPNVDRSVMIDLDVLDSFMRGFYGYGMWAAKLWFIGMEEGGGDSLAEIERRVRAWDDRGRKELEDLYEYHRAIGITQYFGPSAKIQTTWGKLARITLATGGGSVDTEEVREYQRSKLGRKDGSTAVIELLPLPSPSTAHWLYSATGIEHLSTREAYSERVAPPREQDIRHFIAQYRPETVVFYGLKYRESWERIAQSRFVPVVGQKFFTAENNPKVMLSPHPAAKGPSSSDWEEIGHFIGKVSRAGRATKA